VAVAYLGARNFYNILYVTVAKNDGGAPDSTCQAPLRLQKSSKSEKSEYIVPLAAFSARVALLRTTIPRPFCSKDIGSFPNGRNLRLNAGLGRTAKKTSLRWTSPIEIALGPEVAINHRNSETTLPEVNKTMVYPADDLQ
jgi:hypothetical protein